MLERKENKRCMRVDTPIGMRLHVALKAKGRSLTLMQQEIRNMYRFWNRNINGIFRGY